jgi:pSer/pThr/pTyr-binding forkhead associated (FHA) protein
MCAALFCVKGPCEGREFPLDGRGFVIGRDVALCALVLNSPAISRSHVNLFVAPDGRVIAQDLGSTNGTWLLASSGGRIRLQGDTALSDGQRIALGNGSDCVFEVRTAARARSGGVF